MPDKLFKTEQEAIEWVRMNIPIAIKPIKKANTDFVNPFTSYNAYKVIVEHLGEELYRLLS